MLSTAKHVTGGILWANLHLLFWLSLVPFATAWMGENNFAQVPLALYGVILLMAAVSYFILQNLIISNHGKNSSLSKVLGKDYKGKASPILYIIAIISTFFSEYVAGAIYIFIALMWLIPDRRIERRINNEGNN